MRSGCVEGGFARSVGLRNVAVAESTKWTGYAVEAVLPPKASASPFLPFYGMKSDPQLSNADRLPESFYRLPQRWRGGEPIHSGHTFVSWQVLQEVKSRYSARNPAHKVNLKDSDQNSSRSCSALQFSLEAGSGNELAPPSSFHIRTEHFGVWVAVMARMARLVNRPTPPRSVSMSSTNRVEERIIAPGTRSRNY